MVADTETHTVYLGRLKTQKASPAEEKGIALAWLDDVETDVRSKVLSTLTRAKVLLLIENLRLNVRRNWKEINTKDGAKVIDVDFSRLSALMGDPLLEYAKDAAGGSEEERRMRALFRWMEDEVSLPGDEQLGHIEEILGRTAENIKRLENRGFFEEQFRHNSERLAACIDARIARLQSIRSMLDQYV